MFCTNCGNKLEEAAKFCIHCGAPRSNQQSDASSSGDSLSFTEVTKNEVKIPTTRRRRIIPIIAAIVALIVVAGGVTACLSYQKHVDKQAEIVMAYIDDREYDQALTLYRKHSGKKESFDEKIFTELRQAVDKIKEDYMSEKIDYYSAQEQLDSLDAFKIIGLDLIIYDCSQWIDKIKNSRDNYVSASHDFVLGNYEAALEKYGLVLKEDPKYYNLAVDEINIILKDEAERQEQERINEIRRQTLKKAEELAKDYYYEAAMVHLEIGLEMIPNDPELTKRLSLYYGLNKLSWRVPAFDSTIYDKTYIEDDKEIMYVELEFPIILGDSPNYKLINQTIDSVRETYMNEINRMVEEATAYKDEEYFIPSGYGISYSVPYNNNGIVCIVLDGYTYGGGAHGFPLRKTLTFDLAKGTQMKLSDLISADTKAFAELITEEFQRMYNEAPEEYWEDAPNVVREDALNMDNLNYYITEDSICIYYFPYDLGSYARGFVDIIIPYQGYEWMFDFNFKQ